MCDGKPIDGSKSDRNALLDCDIRLIGHDASQRQLDLRLEVDIRRQIKVRVARLRSDDIGGNSGHPAIDNAESQARSGARKDCVCPGYGAWDPLQLQPEFTGHAKEAENAGDRIRPTGL